MASSGAKQAFSREEARRLVDITERQLKSWEKQKLFVPTADYGFKEILALRSLAKLKAARLPAAQIRRALTALSQKLRDVHDPLTQLKIYAHGRKIRVDVEGQSMEAESGQMLLDFDAVELNHLLEFRAKEPVHEERARRATAEQWFQRGLELEQTGAPLEQTMEAYKKALELDPGSAGALVNMGTIHFNAKNWKDAEQYYTQAIAADPEYALAHFDLANLFDERGDRAQALAHYLEALRISPNYGDAHYNLALLYQSTNQPMKAVRHWTAYLKIDPNSQWANTARKELAKLRDAALVRVRN